jgi:catechol 2,3-dioxygenase-like lactoylglutathione lyase family enzyme
LDQEDTHISLDFLDHVAIGVSDLEVSALWYQKVLGLKKYQLPEWGPYPIFMLSNRSGVALFPVKGEAKSLTSETNPIRIDHFAFNVDLENFEKAKKRFSQLGLMFSFQDHHYFHSIYTKDPDGHTVELTTLVVDADNFY